MTAALAFSRLIVKNHLRGESNKTSRIAMYRDAPRNRGGCFLTQAMPLRVMMAGGRRLASNSFSKIGI
jgi:hypothetical protein